MMHISLLEPIPIGVEFDSTAMFDQPNLIEVFCLKFTIHVSRGVSLSENIWQWNQILQH